MDNEACYLLKKTRLNQKIYYQLVPPHIHLPKCRRRSIQTFKDHFIDGFFSTEPKYPPKEWDHLLPQASMTLNLLRTSRTNPKLSAYAAIFGIHDFNRRPLAPPVPKWLCMRKLTTVGIGTPMERTNGIFSHQWNTIYVYNVSCQLHQVYAMWTHLTYFLQRSHSQKWRQDITCDNQLASS